MEKVRKAGKKVVACLMALLLVISGVSLETFTTEAATIQYSGTDGDLSWSIDSDGHLLVEGSGSCSYQPKWLSYATEVKTATINVKETTRTTFMFSGCTNLTSVNLSGLDTTNVTSMQSMFYNCSSLTELDLSNFDTSKVTDMSQMFDGCSALTEIKLFSFKTSNVTSMYCMFEDCSKLQKLDLSNFDTSNVTSMYNMFKNCTSLENIELSSNFVISKVTSMSQMFDGCSSLNELDTSSFGTSKVTGSGVFAMFRGCSSLTELNLSNFIPGNYIYNTSDMFNGCKSLIRLDISKLNTVAVTDMGAMFRGCSSLKELDVSNFDTTNVKDMSDMFIDCSSLTKLDMSKFKTSNVTTMLRMFTRCSSLTELDVSNFDTTNVMTMKNMFNGCSNLTELDLSNFDTTNVTDMDSIFSGCSNLTSLNLSSFYTTNVKDMGSMFSGCSNLTSLNLSSFYTTNVKDMGSMFSECSSLTELDISNFDTTNVTGLYFMFSGCSSLKELDVSNFDTANVTSMYHMFEGCSSLMTLDLSSFVTSNVTGMYNMFQNCSSLQKLDLSNFDTSSVTDMQSMFENCSGLKELNLSSFNTRKVYSIAYMFKGCSDLTELDLSSFDLSNNGSIGEPFDMCSSLIILKTPLLVRPDIKLYFVDGDPWKDEAGTEYTVLPKQQSQSIVLYRKGNAKTISISTGPDKTEYLLNEELDLTGMTLEVTYTSGQKETITSDGITVGEYDFSTIGVKEIVLQYGDASTKLYVEVVQEKTHARLVGYTLSLKGDIAVNMHMKLSDELLADDTAYMQFIFADGEITKVKISDAVQKEENGLTYYVFTCNVQAPEMNDEFKAQLITSLEEEIAYSYTYSVKEYADYILQHTADSEDYAKAAPMVKAMLNYGGYSQKQFNHNTDALVNEGLYTADTDPVLTQALTISDDYSLPTPSDDIGVQYYGSSVLLNSETTLRHYFTITGDEDIAAIRENYTFELADGTTLTPTLYKGMVCVDIKNINAAELDDIFTITVTNTESAETFSLSYSVYSYAKYVLEYSLARENLVNVIKAMCLYSVAANEYFG